MWSLRPRRPSGARIFLDTRDLIGVVEKSAPVSPSELAKILRSHDASIVLTFTNVIELVPHTATQRPDEARVRTLMDTLSEIPQTFIRVPEIADREFRAAITAFENGTPIAPIDPYVDHWWETFWKVPRAYMRTFEPAKLAFLERLPLTKQVEFLLKNPDTLRFDAEDQERIAATIEDDRKRLGTSRGSAESFSAGVVNRLNRSRLSEPKGGVKAFVEFVRKNAQACPGWRIGHDVYEEFRCNLTTAPKKNDIPDFSHLSILPYVNYATLDRAWRVRCAQAQARMKKSGLTFAEYDRVHEDLSAILSLL